MTDVLGVCTSWRDGVCTVRSETGAAVEIPLADIVTGKPVPPRASVRQRVSARDAEQHSLPLWPYVERVPLGEWELRTDPAPVGRLLKRANSLAGSLTLLERKRLEMARALATGPKLLLLDEIAGGLTEGECAELVATISDIRKAGVAILWIEHIVHALLAVIDRLIVLNFGRKIAEGAPREVMQRPEVHQIYIGIEA